MPTYDCNACGTHSAFHSPHELATIDILSVGERISMLESWEQDIVSLLRTDDEGACTNPENAGQILQDIKAEIVQLSGA